MDTHTFHATDITSKIKSDIDFLFNKAATQKRNNKYPENYCNFNQEFIAVSITYSPEPIAMSMLQERDCFNGMGRLLTRFYYDSNYINQTSLMPIMGKNIRGGLRPFTRDMVNQQIDLGRQLGIEDFFVSRLEKPLLVKNLSRGLNTYTNYFWKYDLKNKYQVVEPHHYQWIVWHGKNTLKKQITSH